MKDHKLNPKDFILDEIESIEFIGELPTVDISVDDTHMFFANDIYSHNSSAEQEVVTGDKIEGAWSKLFVADLVISLARKVEDKIGGTGRWHIIKSRLGPDGLIFPSKINFANGRMNIYETASLEGKETRREMDNSETTTKKYLGAKLKELGLDNGRKNKKLS